MTQFKKRGQRPTGGLFASAPGETPLSDLRLALSQNQPIGNPRCNAKIEAATGQRREPKKRGRPWKLKQATARTEEKQAELPRPRG